MRQPQGENYYKILGTTAKIGQKNIRKKYIEAVKKYPPETHPEEFERIRHAYETLKDPVKRKEYDFYRKYGDKVEEISLQAVEALGKGDYQKAKDLLHQVLKITPGNPGAHFGLMHIAIIDDDQQEVENCFQNALMQTSDEEGRFTVYAVRARLHYECEQFEEALTLLDEAKSQFPDHASELTVPYVGVYAALEWNEDAWEMIQSAIPEPGKEVAEDADLFVNWIHLMIKTETWQEWSRVKSRTRKFLRSLTDEEDQAYVQDMLLEEHGRLYDSGAFREAELFIDLAKVLAGKDPEIQEEYKDTKKMARIQKELERAEADEELYPLVSIDAFEWFYEELLPPERLYFLRNSLPPEMMAALEEDKEEYAAGIVRLSKRYPLIYKHFKEQWEERFQDLTKNFNREMRRGLKKVK